MKKITILILLIFTVTLSGQNKLLSTISESFDGNSWTNNDGSNYEYDANNNLIFETEFFWNGVENNWKNNYTVTYTYNANNKATSEIGKKWNGVTSQFENEYRATFTYNGNGDITQYIEEEWDNGWENYYKNTFVYNNNNRVEEAYDYYWDGNDWELKERSILTYNGNNRVANILIQEGDGIVAWQDSDRDVFTYNGNNKITVKSFQIWNETTMEWEEDERTEYILDSNSNRITETSIYDGNSYIENYTYDLTQFMSNFANPYEDKTGLNYITEDAPFYNKIVSYTSGSNNRTTVNYDTQIVLGVDDFKVAVNQIKVFPNPATSDITIESSGSVIKNVEIYNTLGSKVFTTQENKFDIDFLKAGVYFINITSNEGTMVTRKIIKN